MCNLLRASAALLCAMTAGQARAFTSPPATNVTFTSGGVNVRVDAYISTAAGLRPSIVYLYGSDGMTLFPLGYKSLGTLFASEGFNFYIVRYFDKTGTAIADPLTVYKRYSEWLQVVSDATRWVSSQPGVDPQRIGLMGLSLGAGLGIQDASRDLLVKALVEWSGGVPTWYHKTTNTYISRMPPTLILHGAKDGAVSSAYSLEKLLQSLRTPYQIHVYPNAGHTFLGADYEDALNRTLQFFRTYLGN
jgi:dipeptidyl aminopeptidase/acylaminoacyl peptidase